MKSPKVSVIIPCYNYARFLTATLRSLQNQSLSDFECIIVDDGSVDDTRAVADTFIRKDKRYFYLYQQNQGLSAARNAGMKMARGQFIQFLDADDLLSDQKLLLQSDFMTANPDIDISYTDALYFSDADHSIQCKSFYFENGELHFSREPWIKKIDAKGPGLVRLLLFDNIAPVNSMLIRRSVIDRVGFFNTTYLSLEDWEFWWQCAFQDLRFSHFDSHNAYAMIRLHTSSMTADSYKMSLYRAKFYHEALQQLRQHCSQQFRDIAQQNSREIDLRQREILKKIGIFNLRRLRQLAKELGAMRFLKLYIKELNAMRRLSARRPGKKSIK